MRSPRSKAAVIAHAVLLLSVGSCLAVASSVAGVHFAAPVQFPVHAPQAVAAADLDKDSDSDIVVGSSDSLRIFLNTGSGVFIYSRGYILSHGSNDVVVTDLNADGMPDIAWTTNAYSSSYVGILLGLGGGQFGFTAYFDDY